jgi:imidazolonepropionase-like amidohydrolase
MLRILTCNACLALLATTVCAQTLTINNASVIDVTTGKVLTRATIEIDGNRIARIRTLDVARPPDGDVIDATGLFVIPGLWDMHVHSYFGDSTSFAGGSRLILPLFIANGVTGIRDMGSNLDAVLHARDSVTAHTLVGPRMVVSGPMLDGPRSQYRAAIRIASPEEGRAAVRMLKERGVDFIKLQSGVPRDAYFAIADEAGRLGIPFEGHVPDAIRAVEAIGAHQASFEHLLGVFRRAPAWRIRWSQAVRRDTPSTCARMMLSVSARSFERWRNITYGNARRSRLTSTGQTTSPLIQPWRSGHGASSIAGASR